MEAKVWHLFYGPDFGGYYVYIVFSGEVGYSFRMKDIKFPSSETTERLLENKSEGDRANRNCEPMKFVQFNKANHTLLFKENADESTKFYVLFTFAPDFSRVLLNYELEDGQFPYGVMQLKDFVEESDYISNIYYAQPEILYPKSEVLELVSVSVDNNLGEEDYIGSPDIKSLVILPEGDVKDIQQK